MLKKQSSQMARPTVSLDETLAQRRLEQLLNQCSYEKILKVAVKAKDPIKVIEQSLKAALKLGRGERILKLYYYLKKINSQNAALYSEHVAPFIRVANETAKFSVGQFAPGREIWNIPARMRKEIHKKIIS